MLARCGVGCNCFCMSLLHFEGSSCIMVIHKPVDLLIVHGGLRCTANSSWFNTLCGFVHFC